MIKYHQLMNPLIKALINLGGSGNIDEIYEEIITLEKFDEETLAVMHNPEKSNQTEIGYRLAWARTYLKKAGYLENSSRGIWALTDKARQVSEIDGREIANHVRSLDKKASTTNGSPSDPESDDSPEEASTW
ncbi:MAG: Mrr restriction system protein, partial [Olavius algarvensis spirochete endosymbiont]